MNRVVFEGKEYQDIDQKAQDYLAAAHLYTFRYFPADKVWMASDVTAEHFGILKFYKIEKPDDGPVIAYEADRQRDRELYRRVLNGENPVSDHIRSRDGEKHYHVTLTVLEKDGAGRPLIIGGIIEEYDERTKNMEYIHLLAEDYYSVFYVDFIKDEVSTFRVSDYINNKLGAAIAAGLGYKKLIEAYISHEVAEEERPEMREVTSYKNYVKKLKKKKIYTHDFRIFRNGKNSYIRMKVVNISEGDVLEKVVIGFSDVTVTKQEQTERLAYRDEVTLGYNFNYFSETLKSQTAPGYLVSVDVYAFKMVNVVRGVSVGDQVLQEIYRIIHRHIKNKGFLGHVNADHYIFFLTLDQEEEVVHILNKITGDFPKLVEKFDIPAISPYFGVTSWNPGERVQVKFSQANMAKHKIKDSIDTNYGFYSEEDNQAMVEEKLIEESFQKALEEEEFEIWYQPKYSPGTRDLTGAEALVRWKRPDGTLMPPGLFIPIFEKTGVIRELDQYVFTKVCRQQKEWMARYGRTVPISVNLSRASLYYTKIVDIYRNIVEETGVSPDMTPIEITESAAILNSEIKRLADDFYQAGFPMHIDDFGSGYSSLATLNMMKFDTLKLDKSLIDFIGEYGGDSLIKHTVAMAKDLGIHVTAEGVEHEEQVRFLQSVDCDNIQGFIYSKPIQAEDFGELLEHEHISEKYMYKA